MPGTLFIIARASNWNADVWHGPPVSLGVTLCADGVVSNDLLPPGSTTCMPDDLIDPESVRRAFLDFLETWPRRAGTSHDTLDDWLTLDGRYSIWWTRVAAHRQPDHGVFRYFRVAALVNAAIERHAPEVIRLLTHDPIVALLVQSRANEAAIRVERVRGCAAPSTVESGNDARSTMRWLCGSTAHALTHWFANVASVLRCKWALRARRWRPSLRPAIVFASRFELYLTLRNGTLSLLNWREIGEALGAADASIEQIFLPRAIGRVVDCRDDTGGRRVGVHAVRDARAPLLVRECFLPVRGQVASIARQMLASWRFFRIAATRRFRESFRFAGTDMAPLLVPDLSDEVAHIVDWSFKTAQLRCALRAAGDVRVVIVTEEMYPWSMPVLAAASALGIRTVGVQHGNIMPAHLTYRVPRGHVRYAPIPDYLAVYGPYAKEIVTEMGEYPPSGVWITGAARLDGLVNRRIPKDVAHARLGLPAGKRVVVLATQTFSWFSAAIRAVLDCVRHYPDVVLCIKKHQSSRAMSADDLRLLASEAGAGDVRVFESDLELLLFASDVWISASSTTILESALIGTRSICLNFSGEPDRYPYVEDGASLPARSVAELTRSLSRALNTDPDPGSGARRLAFLTRHAGPTKDGRGASTLAERVIELCQIAGRSRLPRSAA